METKVEMRVSLDIGAIERAITRGAENAMPAVGEALREFVDGCFERQGTPWGAAWQPLKPSTIERRRQPNAIVTILVDNGILRGSIAAEPTTPTPGVMRARVIAGGPAAAYAAAHQWGTGRIPARPFMPLVGNPESPTVDLPPEWRAEALATIKDSMDYEIEQERERVRRATAAQVPSGVRR